MPFIISFLARFFVTLFGGLGRFLVGFCTPLLAPIFSFIGKYFDKIKNVVLVYGLVCIAIGAAWAAVYLVVATIKFGAPDDLLVLGTMFLPSNLEFCCAALLTAKFAHIVVLMKVRFTEYFLNS